jgi:hypothetical protein
MATTAPQSYASHAHRPTQTGIAGLFGAVAFILIVVGLFRAPSLQSVALLCLAISVMTLVAISRLYIVRLQDRIIRLEMQVRLERLGRSQLFSRLSTPQIIALRFASDAELPTLADRAATENLTPDQIKKEVREWQADLHRT